METEAPYGYRHYVQVTFGSCTTVFLAGSDHLRYHKRIPLAHSVTFAKEFAEPEHAEETAKLWQQEIKDLTFTPISLPAPAPLRPELYKPPRKEQRKCRPWNTGT